MFVWVDKVGVESPVSSMDCAVLAGTLRNIWNYVMPNKIPLTRVYDMSYHDEEYLVRAIQFMLVELLKRQAYSSELNHMLACTIDDKECIKILRKYE